MVICEVYSSVIRECGGWATLPIVQSGSIRDSWADEMVLSRIPNRSLRRQNSEIDP